MSSLALKTIDFHSQQLLTLTKDGVNYVVMKPICENIGLDWTAQRQRIMRDEVLNSTMVITTTVAEDGKKREMLCLPIQYLNGWLFGVDVSRVKDEIKDKLMMYKKECYQVLHDYWTKGVAINKRTTISVEQQQTIRSAVAKRCKKDSVHYQTLWTALKHQFKVCKYELIEASDFNEAMAFIENIQLQQVIDHQPLNIQEFLNRQSNQIMDYVQGLEQAIFTLTGKYPQRPFNRDDIAKGVIGACLNHQTIELNFSESGLGFNLVDRATLRIHGSNIAEHIKLGNVNKKYLDDIIQASVARLA